MKNVSNRTTLSLLSLASILPENLLTQTQRSFVTKLYKPADFIIAVQVCDATMSDRKSVVDNKNYDLPLLRFIIALQWVNEQCIAPFREKCRIAAGRLLVTVPFCNHLFCRFILRSVINFSPFTRRTICIPFPNIAAHEPLLAGKIFIKSF